MGGKERNVHAAIDMIIRRMVTYKMTSQSKCIRMVLKPDTISKIKIKQLNKLSKCEIVILKDDGRGSKFTICSIKGKLKNIVHCIQLMSDRIDDIERKQLFH